MGKGKYKKCFQDLSECQLFLEFPFNYFFFHLFFFKPTLLPSISLLKIWWEPFLFSSFWHFSFFFFFSFYSFFFLLWILFQTTTLRKTNQIPSWNTMDKGFKKERLIKRLNKVTSDDVSRKKTQNTYMAQSRQKWPNLISQRLVQFIQHQWLQKIQVWHCFFFLARRKNNETTTGEICYALPN